MPPQTENLPADSRLHVEEHKGNVRENDGLEQLFNVKEGEPQATPPADQTPPPAEPAPEAPPPAAPTDQPPAAEKPAEQTPPATPPADEDSPELKALLAEAIPTKSPKTAEQMEGYKKKWSGLVRMLEKKLRETSSVPTKLQETIGQLGQKIKDQETQINELSGFRLVVDYQTDPEFLKTHEAPYKEKQDEIRKFFKELGVDDASMSFLEQSWGNEIALRGIARKISEQNVDAGDMVKDHLDELRKITRGRDKAITEITKNRDKILTERKQVNIKGEAEREGKIEARFKELLAQTNGEGKDVAPRFGFLMKLNPPATATAEQRAQIEEHNKMVDTETSYINQLARTNEPADRVDQALMTRLVPRLTDMYWTEKKRADEAEKKLAEIQKSKNFSNKTPTPPARGSNSGGETPEEKPAPGGYQSGGESFDAAFKGMRW